MHIDRQVSAAADLRGHLQHADAPARETANFSMRLDPAHQIGIGQRGLHGGVDVDAGRAVEIGIKVSFESADQIG